MPSIACEMPQKIQVHPNLVSTRISLPPLYVQGLAFDTSQLVVSSGLPSKSKIFDPQRQRTLTQLPNHEFGEGITKFKNSFYWGTLGDGIFRYSKSTGLQITNSPIRSVWGLASYNETIVVSDGSADIKFLNPQTGKVERTLTVFNDKLPQTKLNELEAYQDNLLANVYMSDEVVEISLSSGCVSRIFNFSEFIISQSLEHRYPSDAAICPEACKERDFVLNGLAYESKSKLLYFTGKNWKKIFSLRMDHLRQ